MCGYLEGFLPSRAWRLVLASPATALTWFNFSPAGGRSGSKRAQGTRPGSQALFMPACGENNPRILLTSASVRTHRTCAS